MNVVSDWIRKLDLTAIANHTLDYDELAVPVVGFAFANRELVKVLQRRVASSSAEPRTPPNQTSVPANPKFLGQLQLLD